MTKQRRHRLAVAAVLVFAAFSTGNVFADPVERWSPLLAEASARFEVPISLLRAVMRAESGGLDVVNGRPTTSIAGAMGLMQIMPATWSELRNRHVLGNDPYAPRDNVLAGAAYLAAMRARYGVRLGVAAYHAGPARVDAHLNGVAPLPMSTRDYLTTVFEHDGSWTRALQAGVQHVGWDTAPLFVARSVEKLAQGTPAVSARRDGLFVTLSTSHWQDLSAADRRGTTSSVQSQ